MERDYSITYRDNGGAAQIRVRSSIVKGRREMVDSLGRVLRIEGNELKRNGRCIGVAPVLSSKD